jgi:pimeloyl-ACP methyl ester carboxylesterase
LITLTPTEGYVDAAGVNTYYEIDGDGEPLVLLHGGLVSIEAWEAQRRALAERFRVYLPERRGHGRTADVPGPTGYDIMARDTIAFMEAVALPAAHLVGWSDGGTVALDVALMRPDLVHTLVLIGAAAHVDGLTEGTKASIDTDTAEDMPPFLREPYDRLSPDGPAHFGVVFNKHVAMWRTQPRHDMADLARISAPTLILMGDDDVLTIEHAAEMKRAIPDAQLAIVPGTDHGLMFQKPDLVNRLLVDFLTAPATVEASSAQAAS